MKVEIKHSKRRKRTISAKLDGDTMYIYAPQGMREKELHKVIENFKKRFDRRNLKKKLNKEKKIKDVFNRLNKRYFDGQIKITSIEYVTDQERKFGCCNYRKKTIRISHYLAEMPGWVRDYVIVHEMAHILQPNHSKSFWDIVYHYKLTERARGFLIATGLSAATPKLESGEESDINVR